MHPYFNTTVVLLVHEERLREAERHRRNRPQRQEPRRPRWWRRHGDGGLRKSDHTLAA
jgi:hypothetical protein